MTFLLLLALLAAACASSQPSAITETAALGTDGAPTSTPLSATTPREQPSTSPQQSVDQPEAVVPEGIAAVDAPTWVSFSIENDYGVHGLTTTRGIMSDSGDLLILSPQRIPHHSLALVLDGTAWELRQSEWAIGWVEAEEELLAEQATSFFAVLQPLFERGPLSEDVEVELDGETLVLAYDVAPHEPNGLLAGTIASEDVVLELTFEAPGADIVMPDPTQIVLMPEDLFGDDAHPMIRAWVEARREQDAYVSESPVDASVAPGAAVATTTTVRPPYIDPQTAVGGAILESNDATGYWGHSEADRATEPPSDCFALTSFNWHKTDASGFERVQSYNNGDYVERNGAYNLGAPELRFENGVGIPTECPTISFEDGRTATTRAITAEDGLVEGWAGFALLFDDGSEVYFTFGFRENLLSVVRLEYSPDEDLGREPLETLVLYSETGARRLNEAPVS